MMTITIDDIRAAEVRIAPLVHRTPVLTSRTFDAEAGLAAFFKCENFQRGGAFKLRGASNFLFSLTPEQLRKGVVAYSSGNHAQAVSIAAEHLGAAATIVMPTDAPRSKMEATRAHGARIITYDRQTEDREAIGAAVAAETDAALVPPYDHPWIVTGQGTASMELLEDQPELDALVVCVGGGGLIAGSSIAAKALRPGIRVFGVEPECGNDMHLSLRSGERVKIPPPPTLADGLRTQQPGAVTFPIVQQNVEDVLLVSEDEIKATMKFLLTRMKIVVEPSGAVSAAAVLFRKLPPGIHRAGVIISGGNVDYEVLAGL